MSDAARFVPVEKLGEGGAGQVWKAWDPELDRWVALKLLKGDDPDQLARFAREAQTAARLSHPGIVAVYAVGTDFIAMELVEGRTLAKAGLGPREAAAAIRDAARAVDYAHGQGVIHRDLKPQNLMVDGAGRVRVMDFGLARQISGGSTLTASGAMVGTPAYMSPEQARGDARLDARTDVYGLGATLYELLAGRAPFPGADALQVVAAVLEEDPASLPPAVAPELRTIVRTCLEKEPSRRYASAGALAEDLDRFLAGESIAARGAGPARRVLALLRKRRAVAVTAGLAAGVILVVAATVWRALGRTSGEVEAARRDLVARMRTTSEACLSAALELRRAGDIDGMERYARQVDDICRQVIAADPALAEPHHLLGRILRAQMRDEAALAEQERALAKDAGYAPARYERVILVTRRLRTRMGELEARALRHEGERRQEEGGGEIRPGSQWIAADGRALAGTDPAASRLRTRLEEDLRELERGGIGEAPLDCAAGLRSWIRGDLDAAKASLTRAVERGPDLEEAHESLAQLAMDRDALEEAIGLWSAGDARDRGYAPFIEGRAGARATLAHLRLHQGVDADPLFRAALADYDEAIRRAPARPSPWVGRAVLRNNWGLHASGRGADGEPFYVEAVKDLDEALRRGAPAGELLLTRGMACANRANVRRRRGQPGDEFYRQAVDDFTAAAKAAPDNDEAWMNLGIARHGWGNMRRERGEDPEADFRAAIEHLGEALKRNPKRDRAWLLRGQSRTALAYAREERGADPRDLLRQALEDLDEANRLSPGRAETWIERASVLSSLGEAAAARDGDFERLFAAAVGDLEHAMRRAGGSDEPCYVRGGVRVNWGRARSDRGREAMSLLRAAVADLDQALARNPGRAMAWHWRANAHNNIGMDVDTRGGDGRPHYERAIADYDQALQRNRASAPAWCGRGGARNNAAQAAIRLGADPEPSLRAAISDFDEALRLNPSHARSLAWRGLANVIWAHWLDDRRLDSTARYEAAIADTEKATALNPSDMESWRRLGACRCNLAIRRGRHGQDPTALYRAAVEALDRAIALAPRDAMAREYRGNANHNWARRGGDAARMKSAVADYEEAARLDPPSAERLKRLAELCRKWLEEHP
jgi:serine/threonine-protein kinase